MVMTSYSTIANGHDSDTASGNSGDMSRCVCLKEEELDDYKERSSNWEYLAHRILRSLGTDEVEDT